MEYPKKWRVVSPPDGAYIMSTLPDGAIDDFLGLILSASRAAPGGDVTRQSVLETFKRRFLGVTGETWNQSSSLGWAETDLRAAAHGAAHRPAPFIEALWEACEAYSNTPGVRDVLPDVETINAVLRKHNVGYVVAPPRITSRESGIAVDKGPPSTIVGARQELQEAWHRTDTLLQEGRTREAVANIWWVVESISTHFKGVTVDGSTVSGNYFNEVVKSIRRASTSEFRKQALRMMEQMQGLLSSPAKAGVRHGASAAADKIAPHEARLLCNLAKSIAFYLCEEYEHLTHGS